MIELGQKGSRQYLYGYTLILPWALDYLTQASCLMTDTTFRCLRPYTLAILLAIIGNESIPLGWSVSPTETGGSYERLRAHLDAIIEDPVGHEDSSVSFNGNEPRLGRGRNFDDAGESENPGLIPTPESDGNKIEEEEDVDDHEMSRETEEGNEEEEIETIEAEPAVGGEPAFQNFLYPTQFQFNQNLLDTLPLVTDQGTALASFVKGRRLQWKLCHRHIVESVGAKSHIGQCVARLLRCNALKQYQRLVQLIMCELEVVYPGGANYPPNIASLHAMLGATETDSPGHILGDIRRWARWHRKGCPTTSNHLESVHGRLNHCVSTKADFFSRTQEVIKYLLGRYTERNKWVNSAFERNRALCYPPAEELRKPGFVRSKTIFYRALHTARGMNAPTNLRRFRPDNEALWISARFEVHPTTLVPPIGWGGVQSQAPNSGGLSPNTRTQGTKRFTITIDGDCQTRRGRIAMDILWHTARRLGVRVWATKGAAITTYVMSLAGPSLAAPLDTTDEGKWRGCCERYIADFLTKAQAA
jgi:hypothetical protein